MRPSGRTITRRAASGGRDANPYWIAFLASHRPETIGGVPMEFVQEVSAYLENKPGRLAKICSMLAHEKINIRALSVMDTADRSVLRFVTEEIEPTKRVLTSLGTEFEVGEVLSVQMENRP